MKALLLMFIFLACVACNEAKTDRTNDKPPADAVDLADQVTLSDAASPVDAPDGVTP
jgi:hypothetical protein